MSTETCVIFGSSPPELLEDVLQTDGNQEGDKRHHHADGD